MSVGVNAIAEVIQELWWSILKDFGGVGGMGEWWILGVRGRWCEGVMRGYGSAEIVVGYVEMGEIVVVISKNKVGIRVIIG